MMHGHEKSDLVIVAVKPANKARKAPCGGVCGGGRSGVGGAKGGGQGEYAPAKHVRAQNRLACHRRWSVYGNLCRHTPEVGAVCGKAARTVLCGGRAMKRTSLPLRRREFITLLGGAATAWPLAARAQQGKALHLGIVALTPRSAPNWIGFEARLQELGLVDGRNLTIKFINPRGPEGINAAMRELVANKVDIIVATGNQLSPKAALAATNILPIVMIAIDYDPLALVKDVSSSSYAPLSYTRWNFFLALPSLKW